MIEFRDVYNTKDAVDVLWKLLVERSNEDDQYINISHRKLPTYEEHVDFCRSSYPYYLWCLVYDGDECLGSVNITYHNEIGIVLFQKHRGKGWGCKVLEQLLAEHKPLSAKPGNRTGHFVANINPKNERSVRLFESFGFKHVQNTYELPR